MMRCGDAASLGHLLVDQTQVLPRLLGHRHVPRLLERYVECACALLVVLCVQKLFTLA